MSDEPIEGGVEPKPKRKKDEQSQLVELFLHVAEVLGFSSDRDVAELAGVSPENVANWRSGAVQEFKQTKLKAIKASLGARIGALKEQSGAVSKDVELDVCPIEIERGSSPTDLQRQFRDQVAYDYLGHRFLYYEPMGALAWENLIRKGYDQDRWVSSVDGCAEAWLDTRRDAEGKLKGAIADAVGLGKRTMKSGFDLISLGVGEGTKELAILRRLVEALDKIDQRLSWTTFAPVDVSIPLLLAAATESRRLLAQVAKQGARTSHQVIAFCADFEEGNLRFLDRLPTTVHADQPSTRLILMLGNVFGNLRDEETFVRQRLKRMMRSGDLLWLEIGLRLEPLESDPLFRMTTQNRDDTAAEANRRLLLEGPYRRWEAAVGRSPADLEMRVGVREDDETCRVQGSCNFCHDLVIKDERRVCTMLYSRRYQLEQLVRWLEQFGFDVLRVERAADSRGRARVAHVLLRHR